MQKSYFSSFYGQLGMRLNVAVSDMRVGICAEVEGETVATFWQPLHADFRAVQSAVAAFNAELEKAHREALVRGGG